MGLSERVRFYLQDYRNVSGRFDRIVSVGILSTSVSSLPAIF